MSQGKELDHTTECEKMSNQMSGSYMEDALPAGGQQRIPSDPLDIFTSGNEPPSVENVLNEPPPLTVPLSPETQTRMTKSIMEIFELEEEPPNEDVEMREDEEEELMVDLEDRRRRTDRLRGVLPAVAQLWWSNSDQIDLVAEKLGDGSRDRKLYPFQEYCLSLLVPCIVLFSIHIVEQTLKQQLGLSLDCCLFPLHLPIARPR